ncbi:MAG: MBL fold metallo-hydrolase [Propionibacteriaceae bacterium]
MSDLGTTSAPPSTGAWREVADGVFVLRAEPASVNIGLVVGAERALLVDTGSTPEQGAELRARVSEVTDRPLTHVVVTHWHYDHLFGLAAFDDLETCGHESLLDRLATPEVTATATGLGIPDGALRGPNRPFALARVIDLGDRVVEVAQIGRGHTEGDVVVVVPDAEVTFVGDLLESAGPPWYADDSFPDEWPGTLDAIIGLLGADGIAIPGHGEPVDRLFTFQQRGEIAGVSGEITRLVESGVAEDDALAQGEWPYPDEHIAAAVRRGYADRADVGVKGTRPTLPLA